VWEGLVGRKKEKNEQTNKRRKTFSTRFPNPDTSWQLMFIATAYRFTIEETP
jgi:hypothetical protein